LGLWHTGNDGPNSGLNADLLDNLHGSSYMRLDAAQDVTNYTHVHSFYTNGNIATSSGSQSSLQCYNNTQGNDAFMTFHIGSDFACYFGLDGGTNKLSVGGWSMGANSYEIYHSGNKPSLATLGAQAAGSYLTTSGTAANSQLLDSIDSTQFLRSDVADTATGTLTVRDIKFTAGYHLQRSDHHSGHLEGSYNNIGANGSKTNPIYTIGSNYNPASTTLSSMYGIGYCHANQAGFVSLHGTSGWGMYVASGGSASIFLDGQGGTIHSAGQHYVGSSVVWNAGNDGSGSGLDADLLDGLQTASGPTANTIPTRTANGDIAAREIILSSALITATPTVLVSMYPGTNQLVRTTPAAVALGMSAWTSINDGSGSGLDADLLDGVQASSFLRSNVDDTMSEKLTFSQHSSGAYMQNPGGVTFSSVSAGDGSIVLRNLSEGIRFENANNWNYNSWAGIKYDSSATIMYIGGPAASQFTSNPSPPSIDVNFVGLNSSGLKKDGNVVWHAGNDGSGSGLDADTVDGIQGASLLRSDTADTIGGTLTMGTQVALVANNYGRGVFGLYSATRYQHVWSMGAAYKTNDSGTSYGNMYGITWTHTNIGTGTNQSIAGLGHQWQLRMNGTLHAAIGSGIWTSGNVTAYSDIAVKRNLVRIPNALEKVCSINGYTYERTDYVKDPDDKNAPDILKQAGVVAQEIEKVLPEVVSGDDGNKAVAYGNIVALLIESIKELKEEVEDLKEQLKEK
jgi:hypothetical protein